MSRVRRLCAGALALAFAGALGLAAPASAAPPQGGITAPDQDGTLEQAETTVAASYSQPGGVVEQVTLTLSSERGGTTVTHVEPGQGRATVAVSWPVPLAWNGRYRVTAQAVGTEQPVDPQPSESSPVVTRTFSVAAVPAAPTNVQALNPPPGDPPTVRWDANTEPDLVGYQIERALATSGVYDPIGITTEPRFVDTSVEEPGDYRYRVRAVRQGASDDPDDGLVSDASEPTTAVAVRNPPPPPTTTTVAADEQPAGGSKSGGTTARSGGSAGSGGGRSSGSRIDLSAFRNLQRRSSSPVRRPEEDTRFQQILPFQAQPAVEEEEQVEEEPVEEVVAAPPLRLEQVVDDEQDNGPLTFLAGGLLTFVLAMGALFVRGEVDRMPLPELPVASPEPEEERSRARRAARRVPPEPAGDRREGGPAVRAGRRGARRRD